MTRSATHSHIELISKWYRFFVLLSNPDVRYNQITIQDPSLLSPRGGGILVGLAMLYLPDGDLREIEKL